MSTSSITYFYYGADKEAFAAIEGHYDGYPSGHGKDLIKFIRSRRIVNGISVTTDEGTSIANGAGDFAAQAVHHFKNEHPVGGYYLCSPVFEDGAANYQYHVRVYPPSSRRKFTITVEGYQKKLWTNK